MRTALTLLTTTLLAACGGDSGSADSEAVPGETPVAQPTVELRQAVRIAGVLMVGENSAEFLPCDQGPELWLDGPLSLDLLELHDEMTPGVEPFEGIFIDVVADIDPPPATGPGTGYPGALIVEFLRRAAFEGWNCGDVRPELEWAAAGTEPFWSLDVTADGAVFTTPDGGARTVELGEVRMDEQGWVVEGTDGAGAVEVRLVDSPCRNAMSGAFSHLTAEISIGGSTLQGCGWFGIAADPDAA
ncbi:COG3650 family protein [Gaopeijia maritima]|uniref:COG3650 family protein n=1 Tax=Gaopeijia maritima TaxID=3119007 RepID=UPI00329633E4